LSKSHLFQMLLCCKIQCQDCLSVYLSLWLCITSERSDCFFFLLLLNFLFLCVCVINIQTQNVLLGLCVIHPNMNVSF
jgi:hypothetical protein